MENLICYNRDRDGKCMAYTKPECSQNCQARIVRLEDKAKLLRCLLAQTQSKKDHRKLEKELEETIQASQLIKEGKFEGWMSCYFQDLRRGEKGGASESDSNRATGMKQLMKDNRPVGIKPTKAQLEEYKKALLEFEEEVGEKMEKLGRTGLSHSRVDSYTNVPICYTDDVDGCKGMITGGGNLNKECRKCPWLKGTR